jgi:Large eukaryotic DNA virus major capsid protein/Major capsid protein N-terminus
MSHMTSSSATCSGASAGGTLTELIALGAADQYLTANPTITFFRFRYNKHTNYAMEAIEQPFNSQVAFGSDCQVTLNRTGDLIYFMYTVIDLPAIKAVENTQGVCGIGSPQFPCPSNYCDPCGDGVAPSNCDNCCPSSSAQADDYAADLESFDQFDTCTGLPRPWAHWTNAIGQFLVQRACLVIGGQVVSVLFADFLYMWEELAGKPGKRLTEMVGKRFTRAQLVADSQEDRRLYVPLPFWFTKTSGNALPLVSLQFHGVQVHVVFANLIDCVQVSDCNTLVLKCNSCQPLNQNDLNARLLTTYVYLDIHERDRFATGSFEQLIDQVQYFTITNNQPQVRMNLNFNHPIIELMWAVKRQCQMNVNNWFNYAGKYGRDPVKFVHLRLNNLPRFSAKEGRYFRLVEPYQYHTLIPESFTYCFSFALFPEEPQPSGSMNASRIDNVELILELQDELSEEQVQIVVFGRNWNIFRYREGLGGQAFSN